MSVIAGPPPKLEPSAPAPPRRHATRRWLVVGAAVAALAVAGGVRTWQGNLIAGRMESGRVSPFPLKDLPTALTHWHSISDQGLDPRIARNAGSTDSINRVYVDDRTGVQLAVLVLYGGAMEMRNHAPEVCYPAVGYAGASAGSLRTVDYKVGGKPGQAEVRTRVYTRGDGPAGERKQVTYAWGCLGKWTASLPETKAFHRIPGMFKIHIDRRCVLGEPVDGDALAESFLKELLPEIDARLQARAQAAAR